MEIPCDTVGHLEPDRVIVRAFVRHPQRRNSTA